MRYFLVILICMFLVSCYSGSELVKRETANGGTLIAKKSFFSGVDYLYLEKRFKKKMQYSIIYDCECNFRKLNFHKSVAIGNNKYTSWLAVTDTLRSINFFDEVIDSARLYKPVTFMKITNEEIQLINDALQKVDKQCCIVPAKPLSKIIGYVRQNLR